jgi:hypothetical protein
VQSVGVTRDRSSGSSPRPSRGPRSSVCRLTCFSDLYHPRPCPPPPPQLSVLFVLVFPIKICIEIPYEKRTLGTREAHFVRKGPGSRKRKYHLPFWPPPFLKREVPILDATLGFAVAEHVDDKFFNSGFTAFPIEKYSWRPHSRFFAAFPPGTSLRC